MEVNFVELARVAVWPDQFPDNDFDEFVFVGKSNVGKSSLINCMINRKSLARTSQNPGKTRTINFYNVENLLHFVDLPGFGYAKISKSESAKWGKMIEQYLLIRRQIKCIIFLIDIRHEPSTNDKMMVDWLKHYNYTIAVVATKADKIKRNQVPKHLSMIRKGLGLDTTNTMIAFSAESREGKDKLWEFIESKLDQKSETKPDLINLES